MGLPLEAKVNSHPPVRELRSDELPDDPVLASQHKGEIRANSFRRLLWSSETEFGNEFDDILHKTEYWHHNRPHAYHVEKALGRSIQELYFYAPEIFDAPPEELLSDFSASALAAQFHDMGQLFAQKRYDNGEADLKVKVAHGLDAAGMVVLLAPEYARANGISLEEAERITAKAAVMIVDHEHPDHFDRMFHPDNLDASTLSKDERMNAFENHELNFWSMGIGDVIDILEHKRRKSGFINGESKTGFAPSFEKEYAERIQKRRTDYTPFAESISPQNMARMRHLTEAFFFSDMLTMISPVFLTLMRTLQAQRSRQRAFSIFHGLNKPKVDQVFHLIVNGSGQTIRSDDYRKLWEFVHIDSISPGSILSSLPWVRQAIKDHAGLGVLAFQMMGERIMAGDYSVINDIFDKYIKEYEGKYQLKVDNGEQPFDDLREMLNVLEIEKNSVIEGLQQKYKGYSQRDIDDFHDLCEKVKGYIGMKYDISQAKFDLMLEDVNNLRDAEKPFDSFSIPSSDMLVSVEEI